MESAVQPTAPTRLAQSKELPCCRSTCRHSWLCAIRQRPRGRRRCWLRLSPCSAPLPGTTEPHIFGFMACSSIRVLGLLWAIHTLTICASRFGSLLRVEYVTNITPLSRSRDVPLQPCHSNEPAGPPPASLPSRTRTYPTPVRRSSSWGPPMTLTWQPRSLRSLCASRRRSLDVDNHRCRRRPRAMLATMSPAICRPLPTPAPSPMKNPALRCRHL